MQRRDRVDAGGRAVVQAREEMGRAREEAGRQGDAVGRHRA